MDWFHCMSCMVQPEVFESVDVMPPFFFTSCGHVVCAPCTNKYNQNPTLCAKCGSSPIQMITINDDMPDNVKDLFPPVGDSIKGIYKGNAFQSAQAEHLFKGIMKKIEQLSRKTEQMSKHVTDADSKINTLTKEVEALTLKLEAAERLKKMNEEQAMGNRHHSRMRFYGAETSPEKRDPRVNNQFSRMVTSPPVKRKDAQQRPRAPFEPKRRTGEHSFPEGMSVHPLLTAKTPDELRKALLDPLDLGRPKPAHEMPRGAQSPPYVRRLDMDAVERDEPRNRTAYARPRGARSPSPPRMRRTEMEQREALRKMAGSPPLNMFPW